MDSSVPSTQVTPAQARAYWQRHIRLHEGFGTDRPHVEQALDSLATTPEGRDLIAKASRNIRIATGDSDRLLHIGPTVAPAVKRFTQPPFPADPADPTAPIAFPVERIGSFSSTYRGSIGLDMQEVAHTGIGTVNGRKHVGLTGILVHEMFHAADPNTIPEIRTLKTERTMAVLRDRIFESILPGDSLSTERKGEVLAAAMQAAGRHAQQTHGAAAPAGASDIYTLNKKIVEDYNDFIRDPKAIGDFFREQRLDPAEVKLLPLTTEAIFSIVNTVSERDMSNLPAMRAVLTPAMEADAVKFTDAYMHKYHSAPMRYDYGNAIPMDTPQPIAAARFECARGNMPSYTPTYTGTQESTRDGQVLEQPGVQPTPSCATVTGQQQQR